MDPGPPPPEGGPTFPGPHAPFSGGGTWPVDDDPTNPRKMRRVVAASPPRFTRGGILINPRSMPRRPPPTTLVVVIVVGSPGIVYGTLPKAETDNLVLHGKRADGFTAVFDLEDPPDPERFPALHALFTETAVWGAVAPPAPFGAVYAVRFDRR